MESPAPQLNQSDRSTPGSLPSARTLQCEINETDIAEMVCLFDSGMVDQTTSNAIAISLRRHLRTGCVVRTNYRKRERDWVVRIEGHTCLLPEAISDWMTKFIQGWHVDPISFRIEIPDGLAPANATLSAASAKNADRPRRLSVSSDEIKRKKIRRNAAEVFEKAKVFC